MNEMIERVAEAIGGVFAAEQERLVDAAMAVDGSLTGIADEVMAKCARAAIEAMREPTEAMLDAGADHMHEAIDYSLEPGEGIDGYHVDPVWQAMIDAALKNDTPPTP
jgi:hypothetical protein